jgi:hypothetical protein
MDGIWANAPDKAASKTDAIVRRFIIASTPALKI